MTFYYWFGPDGEEEEFEYDPSVDEIKEFCGYLVEKVITFNDLKSVCEDAGIENPYKNPNEYLGEDRGEIVDFLYQMDLWEDWADEAKEYFWEAAEEAHQDKEEYDRDPLGYLGMSWRDFI